MATNFLRRYFVWKYSNWLIGILVALWLAMLGLGLSFSHVEVLLFVLAYIFIASTIPWLLGSWLTSKFLSKRNPQSWSHRRRQNTDIEQARRNYLLTKWLGAAVWTILVLSGVWFTDWLKESKELSQMDGLLLPANDPSPEDRCGAISPAGMRFHFGNLSVVPTGKKAGIVKYRGRIVLGMELTDDGALVVDADIRDRDNKEILSVSRNYFKVHTENILDSLSRRPDKSTLVLTDVHGNKLTIRYANKQTAIFSGRLYVTLGDYLDVTEHGVVLQPRNGHFDGPWCPGLAEGSTFLELTDPS